MPIKIFKNQGNIFLFLVQRMRPVLVTKTKIIILTKQIVILCCILKQRAASYMQRQNIIPDFVYFYSECNEAYFC